MSLTVWALIGERESVPYEDPGASEVISLHATKAGADAALAKRLTSLTPYAPQVPAQDPDYDALVIAPMEVLP